MKIAVAFTRVCAIFCTPFQHFSPSLSLYSLRIRRRRSLETQAGRQAGGIRSRVLSESEAGRQQQLSQRTFSAALSLSPSSIYYLRQNGRLGFTCKGRWDRPQYPQRGILRLLLSSASFDRPSSARSSFFCSLFSLSPPCSLYSSLARISAPLASFCTLCYCGPLYIWMAVLCACALQGRRVLADDTKMNFARNIRRPSLFFLY